MKFGHGILVSGVITTMLCVGVLPFSSARAGEYSVADCFREAGAQIVIDDTITVIKNDSSQVQGYTANFLHASELLYIVPVGDRIDHESGTTIPYDEISRITYKRPSAARWVLPIIGIFVGAVVGANIGAANAPRRNSWLGFPEIGSSIMGGIIGGGLGGIAGGLIGRGMRVTVTIDCNP